MRGPHDRKIIASYNYVYFTCVIDIPVGSSLIKFIFILIKIAMYIKYIFSVSKLFIYAWINPEIECFIFSYPPESYERLSIYIYIREMV